MKNQEKDFKEALDGLRNHWIESVIYSNPYYGRVTMYAWVGPSDVGSKPMTQFNTTDKSGNTMVWHTVEEALNHLILWQH